MTRKQLMAVLEKVDKITHPFNHLHFRNVTCHNSGDTVGKLLATTHAEYQKPYELYVIIYLEGTIDYVFGLDGEEVTLVGSSNALAASMIDLNKKV